jgi:hypothetical protein
MSSEDVFKSHNRTLKQNLTVIVTSAVASNSWCRQNSDWCSGVSASLGQF